MSVADQACTGDFACTDGQTATARPVAAGFPWPKFLIHHFRRLQTHHQLSLMSSRQLADIGIDPLDIAGGMERKLAEQQREDADRANRRLTR